jgi:uncharacterized delta-60 repeat protein
VQNDGKILIGGNFTTFNGVTVNYITRLNADSTVDDSFNAVGSGANGTIWAITVQSDSKILIGGNFTTFNGVTVNRITRLNTDGSLDTSFNTGGSGANNYVYTLAVQSDGKILIGGDFTTFNGVTVNRITRLNGDGSLDTSFNAGGSGANITVWAVAVQSDGKILAGGVFTTFNGAMTKYIIRLNGDGTLDTSFNVGGSGANSIVQAITVQSDGKILIGGFITTYNGVTVNSIARLNTDGSLDTSFNAGGSRANAAVVAVAVQSDGKILIGGGFNAYNGVAAYRITRLNTDGSLDTSFKVVGSGANGTIWAVAVQSDGKILIGSNFTTINGMIVNYITRLNTDGSLDTSFNAGRSGANNIVVAVAVQSDSKILVGGVFSAYNGVAANRITRLNADSTLDATFNAGGSGPNGNVQAVAVQSDGKILVGGAFTTFNGMTANRIMRLNMDGSLDTSFNVGGSGANSTVFAMVAQNDGKILVVGAFGTYNEVIAHGIARLNTDGSLDTSFNAGGSGANITVTAVAVQSDGKILVGGYFTTYNGVTANRIIRLNADSTLDATFNAGGSGANGGVDAVTMQSDGKILVGGDFTTFNGVTANCITRLNGDGSLDTSFNAGGSGANITVVAVAVQSDSKILIGGAFSSFNTYYRNFIARLENTIKAASSLTLAANPNPASFGQSVTFTATVSPVAASGTVTFTEGVTTLGTGTLASGVATFSTTGLPVGSHVISATYGGDSSYLGSSSNTVTQVVNPCDPLVVTNITDDGAASICGTFSYALVQVSSGMTVTFALTTSNMITFTGSLTPTVKSGVKIDGGSGAGIVLYGNGVAGDGLRLMGQDTLINLTIRKFAGRELVTLGPGNVLKHVVVMQT